MNNAIRREDGRAMEPSSSVAGIGTRNDLYKAFPEKDRLTVRGIPEKTQSAAAAGAEPSRARLQAFPTGTFAPEPLLDSEQAAAIMRIHPKTLQKLARRGGDSRLADRQGLALPRLRPRRVDRAEACRLIQNSSLPLPRLAV
jgi:hypothetical protein